MLLKTEQCLQRCTKSDVSLGIHWGPSGNVGPLVMEKSWKVLSTVITRRLADGSGVSLNHMCALSIMQISGYVNEFIHYWTQDFQSIMRIGDRETRSYFGQWHYHKFGALVIFSFVHFQSNYKHGLGDGEGMFHSWMQLGTGFTQCSSILYIVKVLGQMLG